jgi:hypothetical protein
LIAGRISATRPLRDPFPPIGIDPTFLGRSAGRCPDRCRHGNESGPNRSRPLLLPRRLPSDYRPMSQQFSHESVTYPHRDRPAIGHPAHPTEPDPAAPPARLKVTVPPAPARVTVPPAPARRACRHGWRG